ncbi:MAG TPA: hypothetical protein VMX54_15620 [Vicinamibacteria bacterium]|nr:hypothetical protein [Vicinamibacteria bacterium]
MSKETSSVQSESAVGAASDTASTAATRVGGSVAIRMIRSAVVNLGPRTESLREGHSVYVERDVALEAIAGAIAVAAEGESWRPEPGELRASARRQLLDAVGMRTGRDLAQWFARQVPARRRWIEDMARLAGLEGK